MWAAYSLSVIFSFTGVGNVCSMMLVEVTPEHLIGKVTSLYFLVAYLLGAATGPTIFAMVARSFQGPTAIVDSILLCYPSAIILTIAIMLAGGRAARRWISSEG